MRPHSQFTYVHGLRTHAWVRGSGRPIVIVPGLGCASWMYARIGRVLAQERQVYVYDPPGHGASEARCDYPSKIEDLTDHLAAWLEINELVGAPVLGHSLGGEVCFDLAARYPAHVSAVIACAPTGIPVNPKVPEQMYRLLRDLPLERPELWLPGLRAYARCGWRRMWRLAADQANHDTGPLLEHVKVPTLLIDGLKDGVIQSWTVRAIQKDIPDAVIREIKDGPHALTDTHPKAVAKYTLDFLRRVESQRM